MEMVVDDKGIAKGGVVEVGGTKRCKKKRKTMSMLVSNRKLENRALACRMQMHCTAAKAPKFGR